MSSLLPRDLEHDQDRLSSGDEGDEVSEDGRTEEGLSGTEEDSAPEDFEVIHHEDTDSSNSEDEDDDVDITELEKTIKSCLGLGFRICLASLVLLGLFDFFFSSIWLHGYVWALNQNYTRKDISEKSEGFLQNYQDLLLPRGLKAFLLTLAVVSIVAFLKCLKVETLRVWDLLKMSLLVGVIVGLNRCTQEKHKIYPSLHEGTFAYLGFFAVSFIILVKRGSPAPKIAEEPEQPMLNAKETDDHKKNE